jgi:serine/threonine-protein kinase HipA
MERKLQVRWWDGSIVGHLVHRGAVYFVYDEAWLRRGLNLSPISLPFTDTAFNGSKGGKGIEGLPGLIADCLPDAWGRKVARAEFAAKKWGEPGIMSLLAWRGRRGLGALGFEPASDADDFKLELVSAKALARGAAEIERGSASEVLPQLIRGGTAGGALPKSIVLAYPDGTLRVGEEDGEGIPSLLKFDATEDGVLARCEHVFARMARMAGIDAVETKLMEESADGSRMHLLVKRFDVPDPTSPSLKGLRRHFHTASGLLHKEPTVLDYRDLFRLALRLHAAPSQLREISRRMIFNVMASNMDDHAKNHAFQMDEESRLWSLTPAYDITFSPGLLARGMTVSDETWPSAATMEVLCLDAGLRKEEFRLIFEAVDSSLQKWPQLAKEEGVSEVKIREVSERFARIREAVNQAS